jgi:membrane fusion protein (multidrug efflux system)
VKSGQLLFTIEPGRLSAAVASLARASTRAKVAQAHAKVQLERDQGLLKTGMLSQQDLDNATANLDDADGQVQAAQAQLDQAQLNLSYTQIHSPIDGVAGIALVRVGNLVGPGRADAADDRVAARPDPRELPDQRGRLHPKHCDRFDHLEQRDLAWAKKQFAQARRGRSPPDDGDPGVELVLADGSTYAHRGVIVTANRQIDSSTGTIQIQALVPNPDGRCARAVRPVRIKRRDAGTTCSSCPRRRSSRAGDLLGRRRRRRQQGALKRVELGPTAQGLRVVTKGIAEGDKIVVEGVQKISDGALVDPKPAASGERRPRPRRPRERSASAAKN